MAKEEAFPFITIGTSGDVTVQRPHKYDVLYLGDRDDAQDINQSKEVFALDPQDMIRFNRGFNSIFCRVTDSPPKVKKAPFFRRDPDFRKYLFVMLFYIVVIVGALALYPVNDELEKEKDPKKLRTILYKPKFRTEKAKLTAAKSKAITKTEKAKKVVQKSPKQELTKEKQKPKVVKKPTPKTAKPKVDKKAAGSKTAKNVQKVKKMPKAGPATPKNSKTPKLAKAKTKGGRPNAAPKRVAKSSARSKSRGHVDTYKAVNLKSTINSMFAKGGSSSAANVKGGSGATSGYTNLSTGGAAVGDVKKAEVSSNLGSLTGAATGKLTNTKGAEGLVSKRAVYTAGIPSNTVVLGSMDPDVIRRILREHIPQFRYCYQKELDRASKRFSGVVSLNFTIGASGRVTQAGVGANSNLPASVKGCVVNVLRGIKFPEPVGGGKVGVKQPINFYPNNG